MPNYNFRIPVLAKVFGRPQNSTYYAYRYDSRIVRYVGSLIVPPSAAPTIQSIVAGNGTIAVTFSVPPVLSAAAATAAGWTVTAPVGNFAPITVSGLSLVGSTLTLSTNEQTGGGAYVLNIPAPGILSAGGLAFAGPFTAAFTGVGSPTPFITAQGIDERAVTIVFSKAVIVAEAINPSNYSLSPNIGVLGVARITDSVYRLATGPQTIGVTYVLTASNIHDTAWNPI